LHLECFEDDNSIYAVYKQNGDEYVYREYDITDFTPLYEGSKDTLTTFKYSIPHASDNGYTKANITDLSFLAGMTKLEKVYLCYNNATNTIWSTGYLYTSSFNYLVSALYDKDVRAKVYVGNGVDGLSSGYTDTNTFTLKNYFTVFENDTAGYDLITPTADSRKAANVLGKYQYNGQTFDYKLSAAATATKTADTYTISLDAAIDNGGEYYLVNYTVASGTFNGGTYYLSQGFGGVSAGKITADVAAELLTNSAFTTALHWGDIELSYVIEVVKTNTVDRIVVGVDVDGARYERMIQLELVLPKADETTQTTGTTQTTETETKETDEGEEQTQAA
jgi:hypothetical protein